MASEPRGEWAATMAALVEALGESETRFAKVFQACPVALSMGTAREGRLVEVNVAWTELIGYSREEAIGRTAIDLNIPVDLARRAAVMDELRAKGAARGFEMPLRRKSGEVIYTVTSSVLIDVAAPRDTWIASIVNATDRTRIRTITDTALNYLSLDALLHELLTRLHDTLHCDIASVRLLDQAQRTVGVTAVVGVPLDRVVNVPIPVEAVSLTKPYLNNDVQPPKPGDETWYGRFWNAIGLDLRAGMSVPLMVEGKTIGLLAAAATQSRFTESDLQLLQLVADRVAPAIERARLAESLRANEARLQNLSRRLLTAEETERRRIAGQLHDDLGQVLTAAKIKLETAGRRPGGTAVAAALVCINDAMQHVRDLAVALRPAVLDDLGLTAALRWYADRWARETGIAVMLSIDTVPSFKSTLETVAFRLAQEALTNVARHARATKVWVDLHVLDGTLELSVRDDGQGFDPEAARARALGGESLGLLGMEERATLVGGELDITSAPGAGTTVRARFRRAEPRDGQ